MERILEEAGFKVLYSGRYEADDYAGSLVHKFREQVPVVVMTKDHDYLQLVSDAYNVRAVSYTHLPLTRQRMRQKTVPGMKKQQTGTNMAAGRMHKTLFLQKLTGQYCSRCLQN